MSVHQFTLKTKILQKKLILLTELKNSFDEKGH
jgi:hypothetical protein